MSKSRKLFTYTKVDDRTPLQKLSASEQLRVLLRQITKSERNELATEDVLNIEYFTLRANLFDFLNICTKPIRDGKHRSVTVSICNKFDPVFEEVFGSKRIANYYTVDVDRPNIDYDIVYYIKVKLTVKSA